MNIEIRLDIIIGLLLLLLVGNIMSIVSTIVSATRLLSGFGNAVRAVWGWVLKRKHLMDKTWPVEPIVRSIEVNPIVQSSVIEVVVEYVLNPREVPVAIQDARIEGLYRTRTGDIEDLYLQPVGETLRSTPLRSAVGQTIYHKGHTAPYTTRFEIPVPRGEKYSFHGCSFVIEAESLPCRTNIKLVDM